MIDFREFEIIEALAGSGKTQELMFRFLRLMKSGADPKQFSQRPLAERLLEKFGIA